MTRDDSPAGPPTPEQTALLDFLLRVPFAERDQITATRDRLLFKPSCTCGCPSFSAHLDGIECDGGDWKLPPEATTLDEDDENPIEVLLFGCQQGLHVEVVDNASRKGLPLPSPSELALIVDPNAGAWG